MARLTRNLLKALGIEDEGKQDEIINAHRESVDPLKEERDRYREAAEQLPEVRKELDSLKKAAQEAEKDPYKAQYEETKKAFDDYKKDVEAREAKAKKAGAYKNLLKKAGISEKRIDAILKVSDDAVDAMELDDKGGVVDEAARLKEIDEAWSDFKVVEGREGQEPSTPPAGNGGGGEGKSRAAKAAEKFYSARYGTNNGGDKKQ